MNNEIKADIKFTIQLTLQILERVSIFMASIGLIIVSLDFLGSPMIIPEVRVVVFLVFVSFACMPICAFILFFSKRKWKKVLGTMFLLGTIGTFILFGMAFV